jgi:hypothetical protein
MHTTLYICTQYVCIYICTQYICIYICIYSSTAFINTRKKAKEKKHHSRLCQSPRGPGHVTNLPCKFVTLALRLAVPPCVTPIYTQHTHRQTHTHTHRHTQTHRHTHTYVHRYTCMSCIYIRICVCMDVCIYVCICVFMYVCIYVCV